METPAVEVSELCPKPSSTSFRAGMLSEVRDVYNHGATLNSVAGDVHYHTNYVDGPTAPSRQPAQEPTISHPELPSQLYSRILMKKGRGYPLMDAKLPEELPDEYQLRGVMIGDVGIVTQDGYFDVFFNICEEADGTINGGWVPEGFVKLERPPNDRHHYRRGQSFKPGGWVVSTDSVQATSHPLMAETRPGAYQFACGPGEGAILALPSGASKEDLIHCKSFLEYASKHGVSWYEFAKGRLGRDIANGSMYLITGYDKARTWGTASFFTALSTPRFGMVFAESEWREPGRSSVKEGPSCQDYSSLPENQSIFLRGYKITLSNRVLTKIFGTDVAETSPMDEIRQESDRWGFQNISITGHGLSCIIRSMAGKFGSASAMPGASDSHPIPSPVIATPTVSPLLLAIHPSNLVNLYLLRKFPESELAISHDSVWCSYLKQFDSEHGLGNQISESFLEYIESRYRVTQDYGAILLVDCLEPSGMESDEEIDAGDSKPSHFPTRVSDQLTERFPEQVITIDHPEGSEKPKPIANDQFGSPSLEDNVHSEEHTYSSHKILSTTHLEGKGPDSIGSGKDSSEEKEEEEGQGSEDELSDGEDDKSSDEHLLYSAERKQLQRLRKDDLIRLYGLTGLPDDPETWAKSEIISAIVGARDDFAELPPPSTRGGDGNSLDGYSLDDGSEETVMGQSYFALGRRAIMDDAGHSEILNEDKSVLSGLQHIPPGTSSMQQPTLSNVRIRSTRDALLVFYAVATNRLPLITRRLDAEERRSICSGNVYVWEERGANAEPTGLGMERWTDGMRWGPSRVRDEFLFYSQKESIKKESITNDFLNPSTPWMQKMRSGRRGPEVSLFPTSAPKSSERLVKQTYSVYVSLPVDSSRGITRKWHLTAYFCQQRLDALDTIDMVPGVGDAFVPDGWFRSAHSGKVRRDRCESRSLQYDYSSRRRLSASPSEQPSGRSASPDPPSGGSMYDQVRLVPLEYLQNISGQRRDPMDEQLLKRFT